MGRPAWWDERRYGLLVHANIATVPAWAPLGADAGQYRRHLGEQPGARGDDVAATAEPAMVEPAMVEVVAHHHDRWGHIEHYDDFLELLTFDRFDPEAWAELTRAAGCGYGVLLAKHADGLCWWDAPGARHTVVDAGPHRNVLAEYAAACARHDVVFGVHHAVPDWDDDADGDEIAAAQLTDLVERHGARLVRSDVGPDALTRRHPDSAAGLVKSLRDIDPDLVVNDALGPDSQAHGAPVVRTLAAVPDEIVLGDWEVCRAIGRGIGHNRNERDEHHLTGFDIVSLLTEVVAKGGHLLLAVGPQADGTIPEMQAAPLRDAGTWIAAHRDVVDRARPWTIWGDETVRYVVVDGVVHAVDVNGRGRFAALDPSIHRVVAVDRLGPAGPEPMHFVQDRTGLVLDLPRSTPWRRSALPLRTGVAVDVAVYRLELVAVDRPGELFAPVERRPVELAPLVGGARPGEIVQLGDGAYVGPADVPDGVILRGLGPDRTTIDGVGETALRLGRNSRVEHVTVAGGEDAAPALVVAGQFASVLGCRVDGVVSIGADDALVRATSLRTLRATGADRLTISRCMLQGGRCDTGVQLDGGADHEIDSCEFTDHRCAIRATATTGTVVRGNNIEAQQWGVHLERTEDAHVHGNRIDSTMRAVDVVGGTAALVDGNAVTNGDSGCIVEDGASDCRVAGNHWERCRLGLLAWDAVGLHHQDNHVLSLLDPDAGLVTGP